MKVYKNLILECIASDITGGIQEVRHIFEAEMIHGNYKPNWQRVRDWLQGLCSTVSIPFMNHDIIKFLETYLKREIKEKEETLLINNYWDNTAKELFHMMYRC